MSGPFFRIGSVCLLFFGLVGTLDGLGVGLLQVLDELGRDVDLGHPVTGGRRVTLEERDAGIVGGHEDIALACIETLTDVLEELLAGEVLREEVTDEATCEQTRDEPDSDERGGYTDGQQTQRTTQAEAGTDRGADPEAGGSVVLGLNVTAVTLVDERHLGSLEFALVRTILDSFVDPLRIALGGDFDPYELGYIHNFLLC